MAKMKRFSFSGMAYMRPAGRGICLYITPTEDGPDPMPMLDDVIGRVLGINEGDFHFEFEAKTKPRKR